MGDRILHRLPALQGLLGIAAAVALSLFVFSLPADGSGLALALGLLALAGLALALAGRRRLKFLQRNQADLQQIQGHLNNGLNLLGDRLADHDLMLMDLADRMDQMQARIGVMETVNVRNRRKDRDLMTRLTGQILALAGAVSDTLKKEPPKKNLPEKSARPAATPAPIPARLPAANDEGWVVSPSLVREGLQDVMKSRRIDLYIQPIARLPGRSVFGYEIYGRLRVQPGLYAPAHLYRPLAEKEGIMGIIDHLVIDALTETAKAGGLPAARIFVNLAAISLLNGSLVAKLGRLGQNLRRNRATLVLEIAQSDLPDLGPGPTRIISELQHLGIEFSLDDIRTPQLELGHLQALKFEYLKIPASLLVAGTTNPDDAPGAREAALNRFLSRAKTCGLTLIAGRIEDPADLTRLLDHPVILGQGYLLGRPDRPVAYPAFRRVAV